MKNIRKISLPIIFMLVIGACKNNNERNRNIQLLNDSTAYHNNSATDSIKAQEQNNATGSYPYYPKKFEANKNQKEESVSETNNEQEQQEQNSSPEPDQEHKKGWSKGAQGAVIGGAAGAVGGAIISKHKGTGAAVGAAAGAAGGYIIGHEKDKKDGRVKDNKK